MAHPYHHALSSVRQWGGSAQDYQRIHDWFDESKMIIADFRHRALRHHAEGIFMSETIFGATVTISTGRQIPVRGSASSMSAKISALSRPSRTGSRRSAWSRGWAARRAGGDTTSPGGRSMTI